MQFESRDGHLCARFETDADGQEQLFVYDHRGNLLDVLLKVRATETVQKSNGKDASPAHGGIAS